MGKNGELATAAQKGKMLEAIEACFGSINKAAGMAGIHVATHYRWLKEDPGYADQADYMKDVSFRKVKDKLLDKALEKIDKGDTFILSRMMTIYFKNIPGEMDRVSYHNNVRLVPKIRYIDTREQAQAIMRGEEPDMNE